MSTARVLTIILQKNAATKAAEDARSDETKDFAGASSAVGAAGGMLAAAPLANKAGDVAQRAARSVATVFPQSANLKDRASVKQWAGNRRMADAKFPVDNAIIRGGARAAVTLPILAAAALGGAATGNYLGGSLAGAVEHNGNNPLVQGANKLIDKGEAAGKTVADRVADPFGGSLGDDPNSKPIVPPAKPGMLDTYWKNLKAGDPTTMIGTGAAALLAAVLTHNLLKKRSKR